jgi:hypothetical protein
VTHQPFPSSTPSPRNVAEAAAALEAITGHCQRDRHTIQPPALSGLSSPRGSPSRLCGPSRCRGQHRERRG